MRPSYIPRSYRHGGYNYDIIYSPVYGGYGYWGPGHTWLMYDIMMDTVMLNQTMSSQGYYYPENYNNGGQVVVTNDGSGSGFFGFLLGFIVIASVIAVFVIINR